MQELKLSEATGPHEIESSLVKIRMTFRPLQAFVSELDDFSGNRQTPEACSSLLLQAAEFFLQAVVADAV